MGRGAGSIKVKRLTTIMRELGHEWVDVLKIDIEGHEWPVLEDMIADKAPLAFTQMQVRLPTLVSGVMCVPCMLTVLQLNRVATFKGWTVCSRLARQGL